MRKLKAIEKDKAIRQLPRKDLSIADQVAYIRLHVLDAAHESRVDRNLRRCSVDANAEL